MLPCLAFSLSFASSHFSDVLLGELEGNLGRLLSFLQTRGRWRMWVGEGSPPGRPHRALLSYIRTFID